MNDLRRVEVLREYELLDSLPESEFDDVVELASAFFGMPISLISLLDSHRQWFKAKVGLDASETPIEQAFCYHAIKQPDQVMVVPDSYQDDRFKDNPLATGDPHVRFYAGAPLITNSGYALGTLCVIDRTPREFTKEQERVLKILAQKVIKRIEMRKANMQIKREVELANQNLELTLRRLLNAEQVAQIGNWDMVVGSGEVYWSAEMFRLFGVPHSDKLDLETVMKMVLPAYKDLLESSMAHTIATGEPYSIEIEVRTNDGKSRWLYCKGTLSKDSNNGEIHLVGIAHDITERKNAEQDRKQYTLALEETLYSLSHRVRKPVANVIAISHALSKQHSAIETIEQFVPILSDSARELDHYIHELNDFLQDKKIKIDATE